MYDTDAAGLLAAAAKRIFAVLVLILCYSLCSSMLLILNKVCTTISCQPPGAGFVCCVSPWNHQKLQT